MTYSAKALEPDHFSLLWSSVFYLYKMTPWSSLCFKPIDTFFSSQILCVFNQVVERNVIFLSEPVEPFCSYIIKLLLAPSPPPPFFTFYGNE